MNWHFYEFSDLRAPTTVKVMQTVVVHLNRYLSHGNRRL